MDTLPDQSVKLDGVRSAEPPTNSGRIFANTSILFWLAFLVAIFSALAQTSCKAV